MKRLMVLLATAAVVAMLGTPVAFGQEWGPGEGVDQLKVMFWNLENFFDYIDGGAGESDTEFSSGGARRWTKKRFYRKCQAVAKTILWAGMPDIVGVAEVENRFVLRQLVEKTALRKLDYEIVHFDSPDTRGIDCALLYRASRLTLVSSKPCRVSAPGLQTRDILLAQFLTASGDSVAVLVNHHPSKYGGGETDWRREVAVARLRAQGDSLAAAGWPCAIAVGDFNDTPDNILFRRLEPTFSLCRGIMTSRSADRDRKAPGNRVPQDSSLPEVRSDRSFQDSKEDYRPDGHPQGSIRFNGEWQLIDLCFVTPALADRTSFRVLEPPFLTERDAAHSGDKPLRTYSGPRYLGGVSDHRPILVRISLPLSPADTLPFPRSPAPFISLVREVPLPRSPSTSSPGALCGPPAERLTIRRPRRNSLYTESPIHAFYLSRSSK